MLKIVSDNSDVALVDHLDCRLMALTDEENQRLIEDFPQDRIIPVTDKYKAYVHEQAVIDPSIRPSLRDYSEGPFTLSVSNRGNRLESSALVFDITKVVPDSGEKEGTVLRPDSIEWVQKSVFVMALPFIDVFGNKIISEAERIERILKRAKVQSIQKKRVEQDRDVMVAMTSSFFNALAGENSTSNATGKEAVMDHLAAALVADYAFYHMVWDKITDLFSLPVNFLAEQYALGQMSMTSMSLNGVEGVSLDGLPGLKPQ